MIMTYTYEAGVARVLEALREDYLAWAERSGVVREDMIPEYEIQAGRTYDKVVMKRANGGGQCAVGFIVKKDTKKFLKGALLMPASWNGPATNFERGNVYSEEKIVRCTRWSGIG